MHSCQAMGGLVVRAQIVVSMHLVRAAERVDLLLQATNRKVMIYALSQWIVRDTGVSGQEEIKAGQAQIDAKTQALASTDACCVLCSFIVCICDLHVAWKLAIWRA